MPHRWIFVDAQCDFSRMCERGWGYQSSEDYDFLILAKLQVSIKSQSWEIWIFVFAQCAFRVGWVIIIRPMTLTSLMSSRKPLVSIKSQSWEKKSPAILSWILHCAPGSKARRSNRKLLLPPSQNPLCPCPSKEGWPRRRKVFQNLNQPRSKMTRR